MKKRYQAQLKDIYIYQNKTEVAKGGILGLFIGLAVIVPGVSGSAVAIIFKMYEKLLYAIAVGIY